MRIDLGFVDFGLALVRATHCQSSLTSRCPTIRPSHGRQSHSRAIRCCPSAVDLLLETLLAADCSAAIHHLLESLRSISCWRFCSRKASFLVVGLLLATLLVEGSRLSTCSQVSAGDSARGGWMSISLDLTLVLESPIVLLEQVDYRRQYAHQLADCARSRATHCSYSATRSPAGDFAHGGWRSQPQT